jgi:hypothetical protein
MSAGAGPTVLVCRCGRRLKAAGAVPGRVGKCPSCGSLLRVPDAIPAATLPTPPNREADEPPADDEAVGGYGVLPPTVGPPPVFTRSRPTLKAPEPAVAPEVLDRRGLVRAPAQQETRLRDSLLYPLWDAPGVGLLAFLPIFLWLTSLLSVGLIPSYVIGQAEVTMMGALTMIFPMACLWALVMGRVLQYLEQVLITSAQGDVHHPGWPDWDFLGLVGTWFRWTWPLALGMAVPAVVAVAYWVHCGDIDPADAVILATPLTLGAVYSLMSLAAVLLFNDPWAANPITVLGALGRVGWGYLRVCMVAGVAIVLNGLAIVALFRMPGFLLPIAATWLFWVLFVYQAMVVLRVLGLTYRRHAKVLGWFAERPQWGARFSVGPGAALGPPATGRPSQGPYNKGSDLTTR